MRPLTYINAKNNYSSHLCSIKLEQYIRGIFFRIEGFIVPAILILSLLTAWTGEAYFNENPLQLIENEEEQSSSKTGSETEIEFKSEKEEKFDSNHHDSTFLSFQRTVRYTVFHSLVFSLVDRPQKTSQPKLYILFSKLLVDY